MKIFKKIILLILIIEIVYIALNFHALAEKISFDVCGSECKVSINDKSNNSYLKEVVSDSIVIDKINVKAPIIFNSGINEADILNNLNRGAVFYSSSDLPTDKGLTILFGHSSNYWWSQSQFNNIFALIPELETGDEVNLYYQNKKYNYQVLRHEILNASDWKEIKKPSYAEAWEDRPDSGSGLALITCWPLGTTWKRYVVYADRIN